MAKMSKKWVALCSAAIAAVYAAGLYTTESQASLDLPPRMAEAGRPLAAAPIQDGPGRYKDSKAVKADKALSFDKTVKGPSKPATSTLPASPKEVGGTLQKTKIVSQKPSKYNDGTYSGYGSNRRGSIEVNVTIRKDKITGVEISRFGMSYPESDVVGLPGEALRKQSAKVRNVSGATYSTRAFKEAVQDALSQARNA
ncbi:FMN-binding protein [Paenibacillus puldeungensis]|uniref:FMN-binding protein n=1 Tax=Paenibacillus puldeungensis TaxID=696536 RepID=A0ABW3RT92_9BACL